MTDNHPTTWVTAPPQTAKQNLAEGVAEPPRAGQCWAWIDKRIDGHRVAYGNCDKDARSGKHTCGMHERREKPAAALAADEPRTESEPTVPPTPEVPRYVAEYLGGAEGYRLSVSADNNSGNILALSRAAAKSVVLGNHGLREVTTSVDSERGVRVILRPGDAGERFLTSWADALGWEVRIRSAPEFGRWKIDPAELAVRYVNPFWSIEWVVDGAPGHRVGEGVWRSIDAEVRACLNEKSPQRDARDAAEIVAVSMAAAELGPQFGATQYSQGRPWRWPTEDTAWRALPRIIERADALLAEALGRLRKT